MSDGLDLTAGLALPPIAAGDRDQARQEWVAAWGDPRNAAVLQQQQQLAEAGWPGKVITIGKTATTAWPQRGEWNTIPETADDEWLNLKAKFLAGTAVIAYDRPGVGKDQAWQAMDAKAQEGRRMAAEHAAQSDTYWGARGIAFGSEPADEWA